MGCGASSAGNGGSPAHLRSGRRVTFIDNKHGSLAVVPDDGGRRVSAFSTEPPRSILNRRSIVAYVPPEVCVTPDTDSELAFDISPARPPEAVLMAGPLTPDDEEPANESPPPPTTGAAGGAPECGSVETQVGKVLTSIDSTLKNFTSLPHAPSPTPDSATAASGGDGSVLRTADSPRSGRSARSDLGGAASDFGAECATESQPSTIANCPFAVRLSHINSFDSPGCPSLLHTPDDERQSLVVTPHAMNPPASPVPQAVAS